ncbi:ABC transporter permease [Thermodesulforhabdus norvegica]|uniref:ABC-2 type transport system permease protein n=1 Tax=Thermodesulforhabdus norvegica TaxID=39841 RepID=A0A1I4RA07_9BACT|nr:ABC-2 family transporter protein [Thermodesulforhabdus norvegica]SFM48810.1 ABC-2 type transport system permease protein [Thermodesulforhabdus norvegica]
MLKIRRWLKIYSALLRTYWQIVLEYRGSMVMWMLSNIMPLVMLSVWVSLASTGPVGKYGVKEFVRYYLAVLMVRQLVTVWVIWDLDREIRLGELSSRLMKPLNPIHYHIAFNLADKIFRLLTLVPAVVAITLPFPALRFSSSPEHILGFLLSLSMAWSIRFVSQYCIGLLGFWVTQSMAINEMVYAGLLLFGGVIAPLDLFPARYQGFIMHLPFRYMLSLPVEILLELLNGKMIILELAIQFGWLITFFIIYQILWKKGLKKYSAVGA